MDSNLGKARDQDSYGRIGISWPQHMSRWFSLRNGKLEDSYGRNEEEVEGYI